MRCPRGVKFRQRKERRDYQGLGGGRMESCLMRIEFQFGKMKRILERDGDSGTAVSMYLMALKCTLKNG